MTQIVLNIEDASLVTSLKQILGAIKGVTIDRMITSSTDIEAEKAFITETITKGFHEAREGRFAGKGLKSLDALVEELRAETDHRSSFQKGSRNRYDVRQKLSAFWHRYSMS